MTKDEILQKIKKEKPKLIYISGKTSTGKTTFSNKLQDFYKYSVIDLGSIVFKSIVKQYFVDPTEAFITVYRDTKPKKHVSTFIRVVKNVTLSQLKYSSVVVEGAIAKARIIKEIFIGKLGDFMFIYFHPIDHKKYTKRIQRRFMEGAINGTTNLPKSFWTFVTQVDLEQFIKTNKLTKNLKKSIDQYVTFSMKESEERLQHFQKHFSKIYVVEI